MVYARPVQRKTKELEFLHSFKESNFFDNYISDDNYLFIEEPYTGFGYPDLILVLWDHKIGDFWNEERNKLTNNDLKIAQHLYNCKNFKSKEDLSKELGFSVNQIKKILDNLYQSQITVMNKKGDKVKLRNKSEIFFIKDIITIEAKLKNWKDALFQASNSGYFSSEVYTLFPDKIVNDNVLKSYSDTDVGIITYESEYQIIRPSSKKKTPITLNGWQFNEMVGRMIWEEH